MLRGQDILPFFHYMDGTPLVFSQSTASRKYTQGLPCLPAGGESCHASEAVHLLAELVTQNRPIRAIIVNKLPKLDAFRTIDWLKIKREVGEFGYV